MNAVHELMQKILKHFVSETFRDELVSAKKEFFENAGVLDENSMHYESRMAQFYDWYFFTRHQRGFGQAPVDACTMTRELRFSPDELAHIEKLKARRHSLFEFIKVKNGDIWLRDLFKDQKICVKASDLSLGFDAKEIFEVRLIPDGDNFLFTSGFCFHPADAKKYILKEIKAHLKDPDLDREMFMLKLIKMRYKFEQYKHVRPEVIYSNEGRIVF